MWITKHVSAFIQQIIPLQIGNLHLLLLNRDLDDLLQREAAWQGRMWHHLAGGSQSEMPQGVVRP